MVVRHRNIQYCCLIIISSFYGVISVIAEHRVILEHSKGTVTQVMPTSTSWNFLRAMKAG